MFKNDQPEFINNGPSPVPWGRPLYPNRYVWFVLLSTLDLLFTFVILRLDGREANGVADWVLRRYGIAGMTLFKFALVAFVILLCEVVGRHDDRSGRRLAEWSIALTCVPVVIALVLLAYDTAA